MNPSSAAKESSSKIWISLLFGATVVSVGILVITVKQALSTAPVTTHSTLIQPESDNSSAPETAPETVWSRTQKFHPPEQQSFVQTSPAPAPTLSPEEQKAKYQQQVRAQAEYLRHRATTDKDPDQVNKLTPEQIAEMEKKGEMAW